MENHNRQGKGETPFCEVWGFSRKTKDLNDVLGLLGAHGLQPGSLSFVVLGDGDVVIVQVLILEA